MGKLNVSSWSPSQPFLRDWNILNFSPFRKQVVDQSGQGFFRFRRIHRKLYTLEKNGPALFIERANSCKIIFMRSMSSSPKNVFKVICLTNAIIVSWNSVVIPTILSFCAASTGEVNAKECVALLLNRISLRVPRVYFRVALMERWHLLISVLPISQVLVIPNIIIIIALYISSILLSSVIDLLPCWSL